MALDLRVPWDALAAPFGVSATVDPDGAAIETTAIWVDASVIESPVGQNFQGAEARKVLALSRDEVPSVPQGTVILAPLRKADTPRRWQVDSTVAVDADQTKVLVIEASEAT